VAAFPRGVFHGDDDGVLAQAQDGSGHGILGDDQGVGRCAIIISRHTTTTLGPCPGSWRRRNRDWSGQA